MGLVVAVAQLARIGAVRVGRVHRRADREAGDQPPARDAVDHGELLGHPRRRIVEGEAVAEHADGRVRRPPGQRRGDQVGRRHQAVAVRVMLVAADGIEAAGGRVLELVEELVVHVVCALGVEQRGVDVDPDRGMLVLEVVGQLLVGHQVKPQEFHGSVSRPCREVPSLPHRSAGGRALRAAIGIAGQVCRGSLWCKRHDVVAAAALSFVGKVNPIAASQQKRHASRRDRLRPAISIFRGCKRRSPATNPRVGSSRVSCSHTGMGSGSVSRPALLLLEEALLVERACRCSNADENRKGDKRGGDDFHDPDPSRFNRGLFARPER